MKQTKHGFWYRFLIRWVVCSLGLWIAAAILGDGLTYGDSVGVLIIAGLILAVANSILRPIVIFLSLPAILITLGLFMLAINGFMILFVSWVYDSLEVSGFWAAMLAGIIVGLVNYLVSAILESRGETKRA